jgi:type II secretion system protein G
MVLQQKHGLTLIELVAVVAIIGIVAAIAVPNFLLSIQRAKVNRTFADMAAIKIAIGMYMIDNGRYPVSPSLQTLKITLLPHTQHVETFKDGWGQSIYYQSDSWGENYLIASKGADKRWDGDTGAHFSEPWTFRSAVCSKIPYEDMVPTIKKGCDLVIVNGQVVGTAP